MSERSERGNPQYKEVKDIDCHENSLRSFSRNDETSSYDGVVDY